MLCYGKTWLGDTGFSGTAFGLVDNTLTIDAAAVSTASLTFRPEVVVAIGADYVADSYSQVLYAPRLICEQVKTTTKIQHCGAGFEIGLISASKDGMSTGEMRIVVDHINGSTRRNLMLGLKRQF